MTGDAAWILLAVWIVMTGLVEYGSRHYPRLSNVAAPATRADAWPFVSIVMPVRDEEARIGLTLERLMALSYPHYEVIVVNDQSGDGTPAILQRMANGQPAMHIVNLTSSDPDWLGKPYAMHQGALRVQGSWILFMDADTMLDASALTRAVSYAQQQRLSYLSIVPDLNIPASGAQAFLGFFGMLLAYSLMPLAMNAKSRRGSIGIGAFQLVDKEAYERVGGHHRIRYCIADDLSLARHCKQAGLRTGVLLAGGAVQLPWYATFSEALHGFEKNFYSMAQFRFSRVVALVVFLSIFFYLPWILGIGGGQIAGFASVALGWAEYVHIGRQGVHPFGWRAVILYPVMPVLLFYTLLRSALLAERQRGVWWRGRFYSLKALRRRCP